MYDLLNKSMNNGGIAVCGIFKTKSAYETVVCRSGIVEYVSHLDSEKSSRNFLKRAGYQYSKKHVTLITL